jgi:hypothetical protein
MSPLAEQLLYDARKKFIDKDDLLIACLKNMSEDQLYEMAIDYGFIITRDEDAIPHIDHIEDRIWEDKSQTAQDRIIDAVLARHGE